MRDKIRKALTAAGVRPGDTVTVALSGGADSTSLLAVMVSLREEYRYRLTAAHFNHRLRGADADADEKFCRDLCDSLGVPLTVGRGDVKAEAEKAGEGIEEAARRLRYAFLEETAPGWILTAHTADDQLETVLMNLTRGTGLHGLSGIPSVRGRILRPMLSVTRREIEDYCRTNGISYCTDETNADETYRRNYFRHTVVPLLEAVNPNIRVSTAALCEELSFDADYIDRAGEDLLRRADTGDGLDVSILSGGHPSPRAAALRRYISEQTGLRVSRETVRKTEHILSAGGQYNFEGNFFAVVSGDRLRITAAPLPEPFCLPLSHGVMTVKGVRFSLLSKENFEEFRKVHKLLLFTALDYDKLASAVVIRSRRPGDALRIAGRRCTKTVHKLFNEKGVPAFRRETVPIVADGEGVAMVCGYAVAERVALDSDTKRVLLAQYVQEE